MADQPPRPAGLPAGLSMDDPTAEYLWAVARKVHDHDRIDGLWATAPALAWWEFEEWEYITRDIDPELTKAGESAVAALVVAMRAATDFRELLSRLVSVHDEMTALVEKNPIAGISEATPEGILGAMQMNSAGRRLTIAYEAARAALRGE